MDKTIVVFLYFSGSRGRLSVLSASTRLYSLEILLAESTVGRGADLPRLLYADVNSYGKWLAITSSYKGASRSRKRGRYSM